MGNGESRASNEEHETKRAVKAETKRRNGGGNGEELGGGLRGRRNRKG